MIMIIVTVTKWCSLYPSAAPTHIRVPVSSTFIQLSGWSATFVRILMVIEVFLRCF